MNGKVPISFKKKGIFSINRGKYSTAIGGKEI